MARRPINQEIRMSGGEEIRKILRDLGEAGEKAFKDLQTAAQKAGVEADEFADSIVRARAQLARIQQTGAVFARNFDRFGRSLQNVGVAAQTVARRIALISAAATAAATAVGFLIKRGLDYADDVAKQSRATGLSVKDYQSLRFAFGQTGLSAQEFGRVMSRLNQALTQYGSSSGGVKKLSEASKGVVQVYEDIGVTVTRGARSLAEAQDKVGEAFDESGDEVVNIQKLLAKYAITTKDSKEAILQLVDGIGQLPTAQQRAGELALLFGQRVGPNLASAVEEGRAGLVKLILEFERTGFALSDTEAKAAEAANDALSFLGLVVQTAQSRIAAMFAPAITEGATALVEILAKNREAIEEFAASAVEKVIQIVKDLVAALSGRDADVQNVWILTWRDAIVDFGRAVQQAVSGIIIPAWNAIIAVANQVAGAINAVFGTDLTGKAIVIAGAIASVTGVLGLLAASFGAVIAGIGLLVSAFAFLSAAFGPAVVGFAALGAAALALIAYWNDVKAATADLVNYISSSITDLASGLWDPIASAFENVIGRLRRVWDSFVSLVSAAISRLSSAASSVQGDSVGAFARGGAVRGPGSGTSDSILAWLSNGEYVIPASVVRWLGRDFFDSLRSFRMPGFSAGGIVEGFSRSLAGFQPVPAFATGGPVDVGGGVSGRPLLLDFGGGQVVQAIVPQESLRPLFRAARSKTFVAAGPRPTHFR